MMERKKKKSKKLLIIRSIVVAFIVILIAANACGTIKKGEYKYEEYRTGNEPKEVNLSETYTNEEEVNLSETYTNEEEGISFKYPSAWVPVSENEYLDRFGNFNNEKYYFRVSVEEHPLVLLVNEKEDLTKENTYIIVEKISSSQDDIDILLGDNEQYLATFGDASIEDTFLTEIDGVAARKIIWAGSNGVGYQGYIYAVGSIVYRVDCIYKGEPTGDLQRSFEAIIDSYKITAAVGNETDSVYTKPLSVVDDEFLYNGIPVDLIMKMSAEDVIAALGKPNYRDEYFLEIPIPNEDANMLVDLDSMGNVLSFGCGNAEKFELNGQNLNQGYDGLVKIFGREPDYQEESFLLELKWYCEGYSILIDIDEDGLPCKVIVSK